MSPIFGYAAELYRQMRDEFDLVVQAAYEAAERETGGAILNRQGRAEGIDPYTLMIGPWSRVQKYGAPELIEWAEEFGRPSPGEFEREWFAAWLGEEPLPEAQEAPADGEVREYVLTGDRTVSQVDLDAARRRFEDARNRHPVEWTGPELPRSPYQHAADC